MGAVNRSLHLINCIVDESFTRTDRRNHTVDAADREQFRKEQGQLTWRVNFYGDRGRGAAYILASPSVQLSGTSSIPEGRYAFTLGSSQSIRLPTSMDIWLLQRNGLRVHCQKGLPNVRNHQWPGPVRRHDNHWEALYQLRRKI